MSEPLRIRRELLERKVLPALVEPARYAGPLEASLPVLVQSVKVQGFEGLVAKRRTITCDTRNLLRCEDKAAREVRCE